MTFELAERTVGCVFSGRQNIEARFTCIAIVGVPEAFLVASEKLDVHLICTTLKPNFWKHHLFFCWSLGLLPVELTFYEHEFMFSPVEYKRGLEGKVA